MTTYTTISNALVAVGAKPFATTVQAFRDNIVSGLECDPTAPVNAAGWHPYNKIINNDANTGVIWSFPVNGAVATITTPDFVDGFEYMLVFDEVRGTGATGQLQLNMYRETGAAYAGVLSLVGGVTNVASASGIVEIIAPRRVSRQHYATRRISIDATNTVSNDAAQGPLVVYSTTAQKILRVQINHSVTNVSGSGSTGAIYMYKRRLVI